MKRERGNESESKNISKKHKNENECADGYKKWLFLDACRTGNLIIAKAMIQDGISANVAQKKKGDSAIHLAAKYGHVNIVQMLIDYGADVNAVKKEDKGKTKRPWERVDAEVSKAIVEIIVVVPFLRIRKFILPDPIKASPVSDRVTVAFNCGPVSPFTT